MIEVELSNIWGSVSLPDLLSGEKDLFDAHMQLRTNQPDGPDFLGWLNAPEGVMARAMLAIGKAAEKITELGETLVVVGSGDAPLAAQAAIRALGKEGSVRLIFAGTSLSASAYEQLCSRLEGQDFCLLLIAQSAVDMECGVASRAVRWLLDRHYGPQAAYLRLCAEGQPPAWYGAGGGIYLPGPACAARLRGFGTFACGASADGGFRDRAAQRA